PLNAVISLNTAPAPDSGPRTPRDAPHASDPHTVDPRTAAHPRYRALAAAAHALTDRKVACGVVAQLAPSTSPLFPLAVWAALTGGGTLHVLDVPLADGAAVAARARAADASTLILPTGAADALAAAGPDALRGIETVLLVGANPAPATVRALQAVCG